MRISPTGSNERAFVTSISTRMKDAVSIHLAHTPEIAFFGPDRARGIWRFSFPRLTRLRLDRMAPDHPPIRHDLLAHLLDWLDG